MVQELNRIFGIEFSINPVQLLLGLPDSRLTKSSHKRLFNLLTFTARKNLLLAWISEKPPTRLAHISYAIHAPGIPDLLIAVHYGHLLQKMGLVLKVCRPSDG